MASKLWPYQQADAIVARFGDRSRILFETGYGPSGLPHIGTFCEVARTTWVRRALGVIRPEMETELFAFSDDMDGLRKVPLNFDDAQQALLAEYLGRPLGDIPDPFGCCRSYADHNNAELRKMLDRYGFDYTFKSSREQYRGGVFNDGLRAILQHVDPIRDLILPTLSEEKRAGWSPFIPLCEGCGRLYSTLVTGHHPDREAVSYRCSRDVGDRPGCDHESTVSVLDGTVKVGWKVDWALRWFVFGVHYEMFGKDLIESAALSRKIVHILGGDPPVPYFYEMFLDESGSKISKSVGKGISVEGWLRYGTPESLALFLFRNPRKARRLSWETIPRSVDEHLDLLKAHYAGTLGEDRQEELRFIHPDLPEENPYEYDVSFSMLRNLAATVGGDDIDVAARYVREYRGEHPSSDPYLRQLLGYALRFHREVVLPGRKPAALSDIDRELLASVADYLGEGRTEEEIQARAFEAARDLGLKPAQGFRVLYIALCGQDHGPRLGPFVKLIGQERAREVLARAAARPATQD